jgi:hypothetical protein
MSARAARVIDQAVCQVSSPDRDGRRWAELARVDSTLGERVEVGVVAVNSSERTLSAELERFSIQDPQGSMARDHGDDDKPEELIPDRSEPSSTGPG